MIKMLVFQELSGLKRRQDADLLSVQADLDEAANAIRNSDEKCKKAILVAMRLADELRAEQERAKREEQTRKASEAHVKVNNLTFFHLNGHYQSVFLF